jgi:hypothetical protein
MVTLALSVRMTVTFMRTGLPKIYSGPISLEYRYKAPPTCLTMSTGMVRTGKPSGCTTWARREECFGRSSTSSQMTVVPTEQITEFYHSQGEVIWSAYHSCYLFIYCNNWMDNKVLAMTAQKPEGPWSESVTLYQATPIAAGGSIYTAVPHPHHDQTGKTLVVTFTNHPNCIQAIKIVSRHF